MTKGGKLDYTLAAANSAIPVIPKIDPVNTLFTWCFKDISLRTREE